ncbi:MAG: hypothetical protein JWM80_3457 [Cyanobacteria bacterium RYN_339]|nr:hypothetical protein [Cyanobacteria bacterium RYN_339]
MENENQAPKAVEAAPTSNVEAAPTSNGEAAPTDIAEAGTPKIKAMRRQPCPCGSGKVFKNCHEGDPGYEVATDANAAVAAPLGTEKAGPKGPAHAKFQPAAKNLNAQGHKGGNAVHRRKV